MVGNATGNLTGLINSPNRHINNTKVDFTGIGIGVTDQGFSKHNSNSNKIIANGRVGVEQLCLQVR